MRPGLGQGQVDGAALALKVAATFPDRSFQSVTLDDDGEDHAVIFGDNAWVFRFPRSDEAAAYGAGERRILARLTPLSPIAVPSYAYVAPDGDFAGYALIAGEPLREGIFAALQPEVQGRIADQFGGFAAALHSLPLSLIEGMRQDAWRSPSYYAERHPSRRDALSGVFEPALMAEVDRFYEGFTETMATDERVLIHGDLSDDHILIAPDRSGLAGVIDFTDAQSGDPAFDFTIWPAYGEAALARAIGAYGATGIRAEALADRARRWFIRYRVEQVWWDQTGARDYPLGAVIADLTRRLAAMDI